MTWPTAPINTAEADAGTDSPQVWRADALDMTQKVNQMMAHGAVFAQGLAAGTYSASVTNLSNASAAPVFSAMYQQLGSLVHLSLGISVTVAAAGAVSFNVSLPVASNFSATGDGVGSGTAAAATLAPVRLLAASGTQTLQAYFLASAAGTYTVTLTAMYRVV